MSGGIGMQNCAVCDHLSLNPMRRRAQYRGTIPLAHAACACTRGLRIIARLGEQASAGKRIKVMNETINELDHTDEEALASEVGDDQLESAADPTKPILWTYPTTSCGGGPCPW